MLVRSDVPWGSALLEHQLTALQNNYSFLQVQSIGKSVLGRPIWCVSLGSGEAAMGLSASHHANEWITTPLALRFVERICAGLQQDARVAGVKYATLMQGKRLDCVPMVNPDGCDLVTSQLRETDAAFLQAKEIAGNYPDLPFPEGWKANIAGIDPNLSYPEGWERARAIKFAQGFRRPAPRDYVGEAPLQSPEAAALYAHTLAQNYQRVFALHTQGRLIYWQYNGYAAPGAARLVRRMHAVSGYRPETTPSSSDNAGYKDWFVARFKRPGFTIEAGEGQNPLPLAQFDAMEQACFALLSVGVLRF